MADVDATYTWTNPGNIVADDGSFAQSSPTIGGGAGVNIEDYTVNLVNAVGFLFGDNKADLSTLWPLTDTIKIYGSSTDKWGLSASVDLTPPVLNDTDFGAAIRIQNPATGLYSSPLRASAYGFVVPSTSMLNGVTLSIKRHRDFNSRTGVTAALVGYMPMTLDYSIFYPKIRLILLAGLISKVCVGITASGILTMFGIMSVKYQNGGFLVNARQTRYPKKITNAPWRIINNKCLA